MCHTYKMDGTWRSLILIRLSQRNLLRNESQHWRGCLANQQSQNTPFSNNDFPPCCGLYLPLSQDFFSCLFLRCKNWIHGQTPVLINTLVYIIKDLQSLVWWAHESVHTHLVLYGCECKDISQQQSIKTSSVTLNYKIRLQQVRTTTSLFIPSSDKMRRKGRRVVTEGFGFTVRAQCVLLLTLTFHHIV